MSFLCVFDFVCVEIGFMGFIRGLLDLIVFGGVGFRVFGVVVNEGGVCVRMLNFKLVFCGVNVGFKCVMDVDGGVWDIDEVDDVVEGVFEVDDVVVDDVGGVDGIFEVDGVGGI